MRLGRTLPPAAAPVSLWAVANGLKGLIRGASEVRRFEGELKAYHGSEHVFLVSSGKACLYLILKALQRIHPDRREVVIPAYTCYSVPSAIRRAGLRVCLCDIDPGTLDFDHTCLERIFEERGHGLLAVMPTHLFGVPADVPAIRKLTDGTSVTVIEDAAQALGGSVRGQPLGTLGDVGFFSLGRGKAFTTVEGGVVLTSEGDLAAAITEELALFDGYTAPEFVGLCVQAVALALLMDPRLFWLPKALPFLKLGETHFDTDFSLKGMSGFQAGLARGWQKRLARAASARRRHSGAWAEALNGTDDLRQPKIPGPAGALLRYPLLVADSHCRQAILLESERLGLGVMTAYPEPLDRLPVLKPHTHSPDCPGALQVARQLVTLPVHPYVTGRDRQRILNVLLE
ncbi:DegT/DnrJ/EryC1/StrS family aminotransferase [Desulfoluna spongiiphila]|uniref:DegT/DnrJ/EryC1/StrS family aminotransferase n=1 Tax=Desulfoluna spongiiphila TaxID=419481 RepID=UPI001251B156|nr:DegT/DnrJ/EryC1/StrS family aminotransferase [Desulfoluna spongiiphila]VVS94067.1 degt/dnrj/eryc1/strs aminotransferase [Desulfoluna spongiiphila]